MSDTSTHTLAELLASLSPDAHTRGKQFEHISKWWLSNTPVNPFGEHTIEDIWLWDEWPDRPGPDTGIDLVARLSDGSLCAIQAKCIDESADIPKSQLDSFISAASTRIYTHRLLIATTDGLSANARRMLQEQHVIRVMRTELENSLSIWPDGIDNLTTPIVQPKWGPRPHQQEAITNVVSGLKEHNRGQLIMACGTGKTLTALWITEQLNPQTTLVLVPSLSLLSQTLSEWAQHTNTTWSYICVCSDDTVNKHNDEPISTVDDFPFEVTTNPDRITHFLATPGRRVIFSTYQSSAQVAAALEITGATIDLAICDEAHRLTGKTAGDYATILDNNKIPATKRLFMTATPRTYTSLIRKKAEERGVEVTSMDDATVYGPVLHKLSFGEAIKQELLSDYRVVIVGVTDPQVQDLIDRRELISVDEKVETDARTLAAHIGLAKATKDYNLTRTISFHSRINSALKFAQDHPKILDWLPDTHRPDGPTWTETISGAMNTGQRRRILHQLRTDEPGRHALLTNARCLTEGVDVPALDGVAFIDPRSSQVDIIQAVGRAIRKKAEKTGTIFVPVLLSSEENMRVGGFAPIWSVLNALKSHDERMEICLTRLRLQSEGFQYHGDASDLVVFDLPLAQITTDFASAIVARLLDGVTSRWFLRFSALKRWVHQNGHCLVSTTEIFEGLKLGAWTSHQRAQYNAGALSAERVRLFEEIEGWSWDALDAQWNFAYRLLRKFESEFGHSEPPYSQKYGGFELGYWASTQRTMYRGSRLSDDRVQLLEKLETWTWEDRWMRMYAFLQRYIAEYGSSVVPYDFVYDRFALGVWVSNQRMAYSRGKLTDEQVSLLNELPHWTWNPRRDTWMMGYQALIKFHEREGHTKVPVNHIEDGIQLQRWILKQRSRYANRRNLEPEQISLLEALADWKWVVRTISWDQYYEALVRFVIENHRLPIGRETIGDVRVGVWLRNQKEMYKRGRMPQDKDRQLGNVEGWDIWKKK